MSTKMRKRMKNSTQGTVSAGKTRVKRLAYINCYGGASSANYMRVFGQEKPINLIDLEMAKFVAFM